MAASSSAPLYLNVMRCFSMSAKYSFASLLVLVPKPGTQIYHFLITEGTLPYKQNFICKVYIDKYQHMYI